ncbi:MAG: DUF4331 family protein [Bdellovibrionales bacterium]|nr:DUF4331 family protein [Bdellovibrionales bacterium]
MNKIFFSSTSILMMTIMLTACGGKSGDNQANALKKGANPSSEQEQSQDDNQAGANPRASDEALGATKGQIERLARPVINEGLIITNAFLNAFNTIPPSADLSPAAAPVLGEAAKVLEAFDQLDGNDDLTVAAVVTAFLPDVMRIDTRVNIPAGTPAYNADVSGDKGILTGGRKLEDDIIDITLSFLVAGDVTGATVKDNVSYEGVAGNISQGHKMLHGQTSYGGTATFPFLAKPN